MFLQVLKLYIFHIVDAQVIDLLKLLLVLYESYQDSVACLKL